MEISFKKLEKVLGWHYGVDSEGEGAFRGRIQHLQRAKVPAGVNTGKGRPAVYGWSQVIELVTVLDLIDVGLSPDAARRIVDYSRSRLFKHAASFGADATVEEFGEWIENERCPLAAARVISASAGTLHALSGGEDIMFDCMTGGEFAESLVDEDSYKPASCFLNVSKRLLTIMNDLRLSVIAPDGELFGLEGIIADFRSWGSSVLQEMP